MTNTAPLDFVAPTRPLAPYGMVYARIEVPDIEASIDWYGYHIGLAVTGRHGERVFLRHGISHHSLELIPAPERTEALTTAVGFSVADQATLDSLRRRVEASGLAVSPLDEAVKGLCSDGFSVLDPNGLVVELLVEFHQYAVPPGGELLPADVVHPFLSTDRYDECMAFYAGVLGFQVSDHIVGSTTFLRGESRYHHSLALRRDDHFFVAHVCFLMESFDHVMRRRARALYKKVPLPADMMNHSASGSIATYLHDPVHGPRIELCDGHIVFDPQRHEHHVPRHMSPDPRNIDVWRAAGDDWAGF